MSHQLHIPVSVTGSKVTHHAMWRPSGNGTTQDTTPELGGLRRLLNSRGVQEDPEDPSNRTSHTSTVPLRRPA